MTEVQRMGQQRLRLLVIDDSPDIASLLCSVGRDLGCETRTACGWAEIRMALGEFRPHAIVLDLMMPEADGVEVLQYLADERSSARIVIASGGEPRILEVTARLARRLELDLVGALEKPVSISVLLNNPSKRGAETNSSDSRTSRRALVRMIEKLRLEFAIPKSH
jgi:CheY-like chemotaxis protein